MRTSPDFTSTRIRTGANSRTLRCCCKRCTRLANQEPHRKAAKAWSNLCGRSGNRDGNHPTYAKVWVLCTREQFLAWAIPAIERWQRKYPGLPCSIDRIDDKGHYKLGNLQLLTPAENNRKSKLHRKKRSYR